MPWQLMVTVPSSAGSAVPYTVLWLKSIPLSLPVRMVTLSTLSGASTLRVTFCRSLGSVEPPVLISTPMTGLKCARFMMGYTPGLIPVTDLMTIGPSITVKSSIRMPPLSSDVQRNLTALVPAGRVA